LTSWLIIQKVHWLKTIVFYIINLILFHTNISICSFKPFPHGTFFTIGYIVYLILVEDCHISYKNNTNLLNTKLNTWIYFIFYLNASLIFFKVHYQLLFKSLLIFFMLSNKMFHFLNFFKAKLYILMHFKETLL